MKVNHDKKILLKQIKELGDEIGDFLYQVEQEKRLNKAVTNYHAKKLDLILRNIYYICTLI